MRPELVALAQALRALLPPGLAIGWSEATAAAPLWPGEALPGAIPRRQTEFSAGRAAARAAMTSLGFAAAAIPAAPDRAPVWPPGITGSISHSATACLAILGRSAAWSGIGLDLEPATALAAELWPTVLRPEEIAALPPDAHLAAGLQAKRIFTAKEAAYKAQYPQSRTLFGFDALSVSLNPTGFTASFTTPVPPFKTGYCLHGVQLVAENHLIALVLIPA